MRHRQKWRGSGERRNTYRSLRQYLCRTPRIQTPHPIETPEKGRTEVPGTLREQAQGEEQAGEWRRPKPPKEEVEKLKTPEEKGQKR